jgi:hypothetical protein
MFFAPTTARRSGDQLNGIAGQTMVWDGTPAIFTLKPDPEAAHADTHSCIEPKSILSAHQAGRQDPSSA